MKTTIAPGPQADTSWLVPMLATLFGVFMVFLDSSAVNVAITSIMAVFNTNAAGVEWVSTAYTLAGAMVIPFSGWLGDRLGSKNLYLGCLVAFTVGSILCACAWNIESLIAARVLQALGGGMMMPTAMSIVFRTVPKEQMGMGMGIFGMVMMVAPALAPTLGGFLVEYADWRWIFLVNVPVGVVGLIMGLAKIPEFPKAPEKKKLDLPGAFTSALGLSGLLYVLAKGGDWGWSDERTVLLLVASAGLLVLFVLIELWTPDPLLDLRVFTYASFSLSMIATAITVVGMFAVLFYIPVFLQSVRGLGAMETGMLMFPSAVVQGLLAPLTGKVYDKIGPRVLMFSGILLTAASTWLLSGINLETSLGTITWWLVVRGLGMSLMPIQMTAMVDIPKALASRATAMLTILRNVMASFGIAAMTVLVTQRNDFHAARIADTLGPDNLAYTSWLASNPGPGASLFAGLVGKQSFVFAIQDVFLLTAAVTLGALIPAFFLKKEVKLNETLPLKEQHGAAAGR